MFSLSGFGFEKKSSEKKQFKKSDRPKYFVLGDRFSAHASFCPTCGDRKSCECGKRENHPRTCVHCLRGVSKKF